MIVMRLPWPLLCASGLAFYSAQANKASADDSLTGEQIYRQQCAKCHGAAGDGVLDQYAKPLVGDRPLDDLTKLIAETMPEDDPAACVGPEAEKVAAYVYDSFYSKAAQARRGGPRVELARLTVGQYRNAIADLIAGFSEPGKWDDQRGLNGEYFNSKHFNGDKRVLERRDAVVDFAFGEAGPLPDKIDPKEFSIRWQGSLLAPDSGEYEFTIKTENGARLWLNDSQHPLIDAWVKSGSDVEYRQTIHLLGGRAYPLRLELRKSKDGKETAASMSLIWKRPRRVAEVVPDRFLSPYRFPETLVVQTAFPPDDRSVGYERGSSVSKAWDQATTYGAIEVAGYIVEHLKQLSGCEPDAPDREAKLREFCQRLAERAFRRPLTDEQKAFFVDRHLTGAADLDAAVKRVVLLVLKSPRFLYREAPLSGDAYDVAARISFGLWDSLPDAPLRAAAASGQLRRSDEVAAQAGRMLGDSRARAKLAEFFQQWLKLDQMDELAKDHEVFPQFDAAVAADLRTSLDLFLDDVVWGESSDFRQLLLADYIYLNGRLAPLYGIDRPANAPFEKISFDPAQRAGLLSHPMVLARFAYTANSSPIHRGVFVVRSLLGRQLRPPPEASAPLAPELHPDMTTRERVTLQTSPAACQSCHTMINPLGFSLERYDALGRYRTVEKGKPIDYGGYYQPLVGKKAEFHGARELATFLAGSQETQAAFVEQLFHYYIKQPVRAYGLDRPEQLRQSFAANAFNIRRLLVEIIVASAVK